MALAALGVGVLLGLAAGGRIAQLARVRLRGESALVLLLVAQFAIAPLRFGGTMGRVALGLWMMTVAGTVMIALANVRVPGMACIAAGLLMNLVVVAANAGMPVLPAAALAAGANAGSWAPVPGDFIHVVVRNMTALVALGDVIPVPWPLRSVASAGDVLLLVGAAAFAGGVQAQRLSPGAHVQPKFSVQE